MRCLYPLTISRVDHGPADHLNDDDHTVPQSQAGDLSVDGAAIVVVGIVRCSINKDGVNVGPV